MSETKVCPECGKNIFAADNAVWLDVPAVAYDERGAPWTIMVIGQMQLASVGNPGFAGRGHSLHEHQPEESAMRG